MTRWLQPGHELQSLRYTEIIYWDHPTWAVTTHFLLINLYVWHLSKIILYSAILQKLTKYFCLELFLQSVFIAHKPSSAFISSSSSKYLVRINCSTRERFAARLIASLEVKINSLWRRRPGTARMTTTCGSSSSAELATPRSCYDTLLSSHWSQLFDYHYNSLFRFSVSQLHFLTTL